MSDHAVSIPERRPSMGRLTRQVASSRLVHNGWSAWHLPLCLVMLAAGMMATWHTWTSLMWIGTWAEGPNRVFLVVPAAIWLAWVRRRRLTLCRPRRGWVGLPVVLGGWLVHVSGMVMEQPPVAFLGALLLVVGCVVVVLGVDVVRHFSTSILALALLTPLPVVSREALAAHSDTLSMHMVHRTLGADAASSGIALASGAAEITLADATGGLHVLAALMVLVFAFACGAPLRRATRLLFVLASPLFAIALEMGRLVSALWLAERLPTELAEFALASSGWFVLPVALLCLMALLKVLRRARVPVTPFTLAYGS